MGATSLREVWPQTSVCSEKRESSGKNVTFTPTCAKTIDSPMLAVNWQVIKPVLSLGVLAELWLEFLEFEVGEIIVLARMLLDICVWGLHICTKTWRHWQCRVNTTQQRYAICSALAASALPALVTSKGHHMEEVPELLLVVEDKVEGYEKTKRLFCFLRNLRPGMVSKKSMPLSE
ncbi:60S ribosomal protein L4 [Myotis brandtii]|uniref:60S ribosomal protein L4 n=1 Tax=Myotis brandtii TaxID=109478 RepID=S7NYR0_MYOBR|nr:60S ribosomal protein L4 [Myotis brandtii]